MEATSQDRTENITFILSKPKSTKMLRHTSSYDGRSQRRRLVNPLTKSECVLNKRTGVFDVMILFAISIAIFLTIVAATQTWLEPCPVHRRLPTWRWLRKSKTIDKQLLTPLLSSESSGLEKQPLLSSELPKIETDLYCDLPRQQTLPKKVPSSDSDLSISPPQNELPDLTVIFSEQPIGFSIYDRDGEEEDRPVGYCFVRTVNGWWEDPKWRPLIKNGFAAYHQDVRVGHVVAEINGVSLLERPLGEAKDIALEFLNGHLPIKIKFLGKHPYLPRLEIPAGKQYDVYENRCETRKPVEFDPDVISSPPLNELQDLEVTFTERPFGFKIHDADGEQESRLVGYCYVRLVRRVNTAYKEGVNVGHVVAEINGVSLLHHSPDEVSEKALELLESELPVTVKFLAKHPTARPLEIL